MNPSSRGTGPRDVAAGPVCLMLNGDLSVTPCEITPIIQSGRVSGFGQRREFASPIMPAPFWRKRIEDEGVSRGSRGCRAATVWVDLTLTTK